MKFLSTTILCFCSTVLFAQNGFFLQPEIAGGVSNSHFTSAQPSPEYGSVQHNIFSFQVMLDVGYKTGKWEFTTGLGYFRTGYAGRSGEPLTYSIYNTTGIIGINTDDYLSLGTFTVYNTHIILPIKVGYQLFHLNERLTFAPYLGAEFAYNMPRIYMIGGPKTELMEDFNSSCYQYGVFGLAELKIEYQASKRTEITGGVSDHYDLTPLIRGNQEYDHAILVNLGMRYNFTHKTVSKTML